MHPILTLIVSILLASAARGGTLTVPVKAIGTIVGHGADNAAGHVATHYGDDATKVLVRGGGETTLHVAPKVAKTVDAAVDVARIEARAGRPAAEAIHRAPIPKPVSPLAETAVRKIPETVLAAGVGAGAVVYASGQGKRGEAEGDAIRNNPATFWNAESRWKTLLAGCGGAGLLLVAAGLAFRAVRSGRASKAS